MIKRLKNALEIRLFPTKWFVKKTFYKKTGKKLDLNNPETFSEKIQWLKLYYKSPLLTRLADKYESKNYVKEKIGDKYVIPTHSLYSSYDQLSIENLPDQFILKATHGSGWNLLCLKKKEHSNREIQNFAKFWLKKSYYLGSKEWAYKNVPRRIICEELLFDEKGDLPKDYKVFCFHGKPKFIQVDHDRFANHTRSFYDEDWNYQNFTVGYPIYDKTIPKPDSLDEILNIASLLSADLPFLRVDMYIIGEDIKIGELTCYPGNGMEIFSDSKWDKYFGEQIKISE